MTDLQSLEQRVSQLEDIVQQLLNVKKKRVEYPSVEPVFRLMLSKGLVEEIARVQAERFINHHEESGWMRGKTKITNWKAAVNTWLDRFKNETNFRGSQSGSGRVGASQARIDAIRSGR